MRKVGGHAYPWCGAIRANSKGHTLDHPGASIRVMPDIQKIQAHYKEQGIEEKKRGLGLSKSENREQQVVTRGE